jgi:TP901 family phage tail tape measure protein
LRSEVLRFQTAVRIAGKTGRTFFEDLSYVADKIGVKALLGGMTFRIIAYFKQMIANVKELDTAMVNLKRVTYETNAAYDKFLSEIGVKARAVNADLIEMVNNIAEFSKLGYNLPDATRLAEVASVYSNVGDLDLSNATDNIVANLKAFKLNADEAIDIVDKFNLVGNRYALNAADIGEGLKRSASSLAVGGNSLDEAVALFAAGQEVIQNPEKMGTALNVLSLRIRGASGELKEMGEEFSDLEEISFSKIREDIKRLSGVDIMIDPTTFKSTYDIMREISYVWDDLKESTAGAELLETLAGKNRANVLAAILNNFRTAERSMITMQNAEGTAYEENQKKIESIEGRVKSLKNSFTELSINLINSDFIKGFVGEIDKLLKSVNKFLNLIEKLPSGLTLVTGALALIGAKRNFGIFETMTNDVGRLTPKLKDFSMITNSVGRNLTAFENYRNALISGIPQQEAFNKHLGSANHLTRELANNVVNTTAAARNQGNVYQNATEQIKANTAAQRALNVAMRGVAIAANIISSMAIAAAITIAVTLVSKLINAEKNLAKEVRQLTEDYKNQKSNLQTLRDEYQSILNSQDSEADKTKLLDELKQKIIKTYDLEKEAIKNVNDERKKANDLLDAEGARQAIGFVENAKNKEVYEKTKKFYDEQYDDSLFGGFKKAGNATQAGEWQFKIKGNFETFEKDFDKEISTYFKRVEKYIPTFGKSKDVLVEIQGDNILDYLENLKSIQNILSQKQSLNTISKPEITLLKDTNKEITKINKLISEDGKYSVETFNTYMEAMAEKTLYAYESKKGALEDIANSDNYQIWYDNLILLANGDKYLEDALKSLVETQREFLGLAAEQPDKLGQIRTEIIATTSEYDKLKEKIKLASEQIQSLDDTITKNKDEKSTFSKSEILELLTLYPSLVDNILKSADGYKIEEAALEELRNAKVEELKTTLKAEIQKSQATLNGITNRLRAYNTEMVGIRNVAEAQKELTKSQLILQQPEIKLSPNVKNKEIKKVQLLTEFIDVSNNLQKSQDDLDALNFQTELLDDKFGAVNDTTGSVDDQIKNINQNLENTTKELEKSVKAMEDGQKEINSLLETTVAMLKKKYELNKKDYENELKNLKTIVDKKKQLLEIEKENYDFQKSLKEKTTEVSDVKIKIETLSLDDSMESIKERLELKEQLAEKELALSEFLSNKDIELKKEALDTEYENHEKLIGDKIQSIDDFLSKEGEIYKEAYALIDGRTEEFYNSLLNYTQTYTNMTMVEFTNMWDKAYQALLTYGNGQINIVGTLGNLQGQIAGLNIHIENMRNQAEATISSLENMAKAFEKIAIERNKVNTSPITFPSPKETEWSGLSKPTQDILRKLPKFHDGGKVEPFTSGYIGNNEVLAKLLTGEVVTTPKQGLNFLRSTLPNLVAGAMSTKNTQQSNIYNINMPEITIAGDATDNTVSKIKQTLNEYKENLFEEINRSNKKFGNTLAIKY